MKQYKLLLLFFCAAFFAACNSGDGDNVATGEDTAGAVTTAPDGTQVDTTSTAAAGSGTISGEDRTFMIDAAKAGLMEVESSRMAQEKATSKRVKNFAEMMVQDHTKSNQELKSLAASKNVTLPDSLDADMKNHMETMRKMKGKEFEEHYISMMKDDHREDINKFESRANNASDPDLKAFATKTLPVLKKHRDSVDAISKNLK